MLLLLVNRSCRHCVSPNHGQFATFVALERLGCWDSHDVWASHMECLGPDPGNWQRLIFGRVCFWVFPCRQPCDVVEVLFRERKGRFDPWLVSKARPELESKHWWSPQAAFVSLLRSMICLINPFARQSSANPTWLFCTIPICSLYVFLHSWSQVKRRFGRHQPATHWIGSPSRCSFARCSTGLSSTGLRLLGWTMWNLKK